MTLQIVFLGVSWSSKDGVCCNQSGPPCFVLLLKQVIRPTQIQKEGNSILPLYGKNVKVTVKKNMCNTTYCCSLENAVFHKGIWTFHCWVCDAVFFFVHVDIQGCPKILVQPYRILIHSCLVNNLILICWQVLDETYSVTVINNVHFWIVLSFLYIFTVFQTYTSNLLFLTTNPHS